MDSVSHGHKGMLFVVATPIGNLDDVTIRALETLRNVDFIACEDTRRTRILLQKFQIRTKLVSLHRFSERKKADSIIQRLIQGESCALVCDSGTPTISDPGSLLVREANGSGIRVVPIPGASSITAALSVSGIDCSTFVFKGFIPRKARERKAFFEEIARDARPCVIFESPKRVVDTLHTAQQILGDRNILLTRELTKVHEELLGGSSAEIAEILGSRADVQGEICLVIGAGQQGLSPVNIQVAVSDLMHEGFTGKRLADEAQRRYGVKKSVAYRLFLELCGRERS